MSGFGPRNDRHRGATWAHSEGALRRSCGKTEYLRPVGKEEAATILNCAPAGGFTKLWIHKKAARPEKNQGRAREEATRSSSCSSQITPTSAHNGRASGRARVWTDW